VAVVAVRNDLDALATPEDVMLEQPRRRMLEVSA